MERTSNIRARFFVNSTVEFKANNLFSLWEGENIYTVYSYGFHFPLYVYVKNQNKWYENKDKYSQTTSKQKSQTRLSVDYTALNTQDLKDLIKKGGL